MVPSQLDLVGDPAVRQTREPFEREAGAERVAAESFATSRCRRLDSHTGVKVEVVVLGSNACSAAAFSLPPLGSE
jgi:hypothetical protein